MKSNKFVFTKNLLSKLSTPSKEIKKSIFYDVYQPGLALIITYGGAKTFYVYKQINHKNIIAKIGEFPSMEIETARLKTAEIIQQIKDGINPFKEEPEPTKIPTLGEFFYKEYAKTSAKTAKEQTIRNNLRFFKLHCNEFKNKCLTEITRSELEEKQHFLRKNNGIHVGNGLIKLIRRIYNIAIDKEIINYNPTKSIRFFQTKSRDRFIQPEEMSRFMKVLSESDNHKLRCYISLLLFTGQRSCNIKSLKWSHIDFHNNIMYLPDTKNNESQRIPLTEQAMEILKELKERRTDKRDWIFLGTGKSQHLETASAYWNDLLKKANITNLRMHDLRRTMGSYQAIIGSSLNIIGKSLGHKSLEATAIYARLDLKPVRESMQKATDEMYKLFNSQ